MSLTPQKIVHGDILDDVHAPDTPTGCVPVRDRIARALRPAVDAAVETALAEVVAENARLRAENEFLRDMLGHMQGWGA